MWPIIMVRLRFVIQSTLHPPFLDLCLELSIIVWAARVIICGVIHAGKVRSFGSVPAIGLGYILIILVLSLWDITSLFRQDPCAALVAFQF